MAEIEESTVEVVAHIGIGMVMITCMEGVALEGVLMGRTVTMRNEEGGLGVEALVIGGTTVGAQLGGVIEVLSGKLARKGGPKSSSGTEKESRQHLLIAMVAIVIAMGMATMVSNTVISFGRIRLETLKKDVMAFWFVPFS